MPKLLPVFPERLQQRGELAFPSVAIYRYANSLSDEQSQRGSKALIEALRHMLMLREFETLLNNLRSNGEHNGIVCPYNGPAHLSIGQEAASVGMAMALSEHDHVYGNHRSHGDFLAKGLACIQSLNSNVLGDVMQQHANGVVLKTVQSTLGGSTGGGTGGNGTALAENFLLFGFLSEILMRASGFNQGMAGSMHAFFLPFGAYPNNAIVGASAGIATGSALHKRNTRQSIAVSVSGDGSTGCGQVWEAMNFAAMGQYKTLWSQGDTTGLPVLFFFTNNFYAMGGQTIGETMAWDRLSRIGAGIRADALHAETVDGTNPLAVADAVMRQRQHLLQGRGPALLDVECYRQSGHSTSDANAYRTREEMQAWAQHDPLKCYSQQLVQNEILDEAAVASLKEEVTLQMNEVLRVCANEQHAPPVDIKANPTLIGDRMFNNTQMDVTSLQAHARDLSGCSRLRQLGKKSRLGFDDTGKQLSPMRAITLRDALFEAIVHHMLHDDSLLVWGEECREWGGAFGVYRGLSDLFGHDRLFNAPISEATIVSTAVGYAMEGGRALVELMYADFIGRAGDEILNQLAKWQAMSAGALQLPVVLRCSVGSKYGAQHSQDWSSLLTHVPGLKVIYPATPFDAKGLMAAALASNDPVVVFESQRLYDSTETLNKQGVPEQYYELPIGKPHRVREGDSLTLLTIGPCLYPALQAANLLAESYALEADVIDARSLVPFDYDLVLESIKRTGRLMIISEACERGSFAMTLATNVARFAFTSLKAAPSVLGAPNWIVPGAAMESSYFVQPHDILDRVASDFYPDAGIPESGERRYCAQALAQRGL